MDSDETYILLLLADSNLPTGSFVASSGLESSLKHGFPSTFDFIQDSLSSYAHSSLPFVSDAHRVIETYPTEALGGALTTIKSLDALYDAMTLNHVAKRASKSQGVALLSLYAKGFSRPPLALLPDPDQKDVRMGALIQELKLLVRTGVTHGHLPICWGVLTAALGITLGKPFPYTSRSKNDSVETSERSQFLFLFLHARSLLSASVRLNTLGPYAAQQYLLHVVRVLVQSETARCKTLRTGVLDSTVDRVMHGPATTWPLGEILAARHDLQHSRIFNS
jgi:urease accessory protein